MSSRLFAILLFTGWLAVACQEPYSLDPVVGPLVAETAEAGDCTMFDIQEQSTLPVSDEYGRYRLIINEPGEWTLRTTDDYIQLERNNGLGCDTLWMMVGYNWSGSRNAELLLSSVGPMQEESVRKLIVHQQANRSLSAVANKINSSMGAGYSYCPAERFTMGTGIQIFNMNQFASLQSDYSVRLMMDDYYPSLDTNVFTSDSLSTLQSQLKISMSANVDLMFFTVNFEGEYANSNVSEGTRTYAVQRMNNTMFTRELNYQNAVALANEKPQLRDRIFASGFLLLHDQLVSDIRSTSDYSARLSLCSSFVKSVGPCFISKSVMGSNMDYWISVEKSSLSETMDVEALLKFKWDSSFSIHVNANGSYTENRRILRNETQTHLDCRGGNPRLVSIINANDSLPYESLQQWLLSVEPDNAVLVDMHLEPIYLLFTDQTTRDALRDYLNQLTK